jgi:multicomponent Na+:H+ antiporter subunit E
MLQETRQVEERTMSHGSTKGKTIRRKHGWRGITVQAVSLMALWLLLSEHFDLFHVSLGVLSVGIVLLINAQLTFVQFFPDDVSEWEQMKLDRVPRFALWLVWEIINASLQVAAIVLHPKMPVRPVLIRFRAHLPSVGAKVLLGNTITLTPGTLTLAIEGDEFLIHAIQQQSASSLIDGTMPRWVGRLFHRTGEGTISSVTVIESAKEI